jgi:cell division protein FtsI/penicillin-binding protein 2
MVRTNNRGAHNRGAHAGKPAARVGTSARGTRARRVRAGSKRVGDARVSGVRLRSARVRVIAAAGATVLLLAGLALGWAAPDPSAEPTVQAFLLAWENGDYAAAAALTTGAPGQVSAALSNAYRQLGAADISLGMAGITQRSKTADARFSASVNLGRGGAPWNYTGSFALRRVGSAWKVVWAPSVIVPGLRPGLRLAVIATMPPRAQILDAQGNPLAPPSTVDVAGVVPSHLANPAATAAGLSRATGLTASQILSWIGEAPSTQFLELVRFSPGAYHRLNHKLKRVPGLVVEQQRLRLFASIAEPVSGAVGGEAAKQLQNEGVPYRPGATVGLSGLQQTFQRMLVGTPTTQVVVEDTAGRVDQVLQQWDGHAGTSVRTTINAKVQNAANQAVGSLPDPAAIVAIAPSTGQVLAVAQKNVKGMPEVEPLSGHYRPGQAFTIVSATALLNTGLLTSAPIPCNASNPVGGENFVNDPPEPDLGTQSPPPFRTDFAEACSTAFAGLSLRLTGKELQTAATGFGLGRDWQLPLTSFTGAMRTPTDQAELAEDAIGNGSVEVSPLDMAIAAGVVQSGTWHRPTLVTDPPDPGLSPKVPFAASVVNALRTLMRGTVTDGAGRAANVGHPAVYGQVGSAPLPTGGLHATWFVGYQGGVAFAVLELTNSATDSAAPVAGQFLSGLKTGS